MFFKRFGIKHGPPRPSRPFPHGAPPAMFDDKTFWPKPFWLKLKWFRFESFRINRSMNVLGFARAPTTTRTGQT